MKLLHIYSQYSEHADTCIIGNRQGLEALRDAISSVLLFFVSPCSSSMDAFVGDGEGFSCHVIKLPGVDFSSLAVPYIAEYANETRPNAIPPWKYIGKGKHKS
ncbi:MAG: hypothetical protein A3D89_03645 [Planctomycetes bacterium RIFCSPHIGHO2_02_FULL_52_58]|nr:MAG: hypothetical protein A3D89_03645 [Planctomycetes bacterium RIFCSPHIGHO2_02_FULL_52_58]